MILIFSFWAWFFSNLFIDPSSMFLLTTSLVSTMITIDLYKFIQWSYKGNQE